MVLVKLALVPFSIAYKAVTTTRNWLYDKGFLSSTSFPLPIISVGNLSVGGTGKTPHVEYLIRTLRNGRQIVTLSRGYGRSTKGFQVCDEHCSAKQVGDEPLQYFSKFPDIKVAVCENRVKGVKELMALYPNTDLILLDDGFQHRAIKPGLQILLTEYNSLFCDNYHLPTGTLRESTKGMKRADIIIVTKTPTILSPMERRRIESKIKPLHHQSLFYSYIKYGEFQPSWVAGVPQVFGKEFYFQRGYQILLLTGIANPSPMYTYLKDAGARVQLMRFPDHHTYTNTDITKIKEAFDAMTSSNKMILTTEKDVMRLKSDFPEFLKENQVFYLPIEIAFHEGDEKGFQEKIKFFLKHFPKK